MTITVKITAHWEGGKEFWHVEKEDGSWFIVKVKYIISPSDQRNETG